MENIDLHFPSTGGGPEQGPNDSGLEHFMGDIHKHLARECAQNSIDAANRDNSRPVRLEFTVCEVNAELLPGISALNVEVIPACRQYFEKDPKAIKYCDAALEVLSSPRIGLLRIADYNTTGLEGSDADRNGQWYSLVKSSGVSSKDSGSAGSFGIGKHAPFAASALRTIYYSTMTRRREVAWQGASKWWSHQKKDSTISQGTGFIGYLDRSTMQCRAVRNPTEIPKIFDRSEPGTDIWVPGFPIDENWDREIAIHLVTNFWLAIHQGDIEFRVGEIEINKKHLAELLEEFSREENFFAHYYHRALIANETTHVRQTFKFLGEMDLYLLASDTEKLPKFVQGMRTTGMVIEERRFNCRRHYVGVLLCRNSEGNAFLRSIEPPRHDKWEKERITERGGKSALDSMWEWVRRNVQDLNPKPTTEAIDVPDLAKYLPDLPEAEANQSEAERDIQSNPVTGEVQILDVSDMKAKARGKAGGEEEGDDGIRGGKKTRRKGGRGKGGGGNKPGEEIAVPLKLRAIRNNDSTFRLIVRAERSVSGDLALRGVNDDGTSDALQIQSARSGDRLLTVSYERIKGIQILEGQPLILEIKFVASIPLTLSGSIHTREGENA